MKKITCLFLVALMVATTFTFFASCKEEDQAKKNGYLKVLLDAFNEKYAQDNVVAVDADMDEYSDLENDGPYGYGPDVLYQANDILM